MTIRTMLRAGAAATALAMGATAGWAQSNQAAPQTVPGLERFSLPAAGRQSQGTPTPAPLPTSDVPIVIPGVTPSPVPSPRAARSRPAPTPSPSTTSRTRPTPQAAATSAPTPQAAATSAPTPAPTTSVAAPPTPVISTPSMPGPTPAPTAMSSPDALPIPPTPAPTPTPAAAETGASGPGTLQWLGIGIVLLGLGGAGGYLLARRRRPARQPGHEIFVPVQADSGDLREPMPPAPARATAPVDAPPSPSPADTPPVAPPRNASPSPRLAVAPAPPTTAASSPPEFLARAPLPSLIATIRPRRAGTNLTGAAVDYVITLANPGASPASDIRVDLGLLSASAQQDAQLRGFFAQPVERPVVAPFELPPGGEIELTGMATLPHNALHVMEAQGRPFFVPVVAMSARYRSNDRDRQTAAAWIIGVDRGPEAKMAPFRLDGPPRMRDNLSARLHEVAG